MKTYALPKPLDEVRDSGSERTELVSALYGSKANGEKFVVPELCLQGEWLRQAGFTIGDHAAIQVKKGQIIIYKLEL